MSNSLATVHPELVAEWSEKNLPLTPDKITFGSNKRVWWKGSCGHEWQASVKAHSGGEKCPICSGARVVEGINDLATLKPQLAQEWSKEMKEFLDDLTTRDQRMMFAVLTMVHTADSKEQLDNDTEALLTTAKKHLCQFAVLKFQQMDGLNIVMP